jgi:O-antigen/teichoic acid export membrane protein
MNSFYAYINTLFGKLAQPGVLKNTAWLSAEKLISLISGFGIAIIAARFLGPEKFGNYSYYLSYAGIFLPLMTLGLNRILMREMQHHPGAVRTILVTAFLSRVTASLIVAIFALLILILFDNSAYSIAATCILLTAQGFQSYQVYNMWFQHNSLNAIIARYRILCLVLGTILKIIALLSTSNILVLLTVICIEQIGINLGHYFIYRKFSSQELESKGSFDSSVFKGLFGQSKYLILSGFAYMLYLKLDVIMLTQLVNPAEAGIYSAASRITEAVQIFPEALLVALYPNLLLLHSTQNSQYMAKLSQLIKVLFLSGFLVATTGFIIAPFIIPLIFGEAYNTSVDIIKIHLWACCFLYMRSMLSHWLIAEKYAQFSLISHGLGAAINLLLNSILIPQYGAVGAAYATLAAVFVSSYACLLLSQRTRPIFHMMTTAFNMPQTLLSLARLALQNKKDI